MFDKSFIKSFDIRKVFVFFAFMYIFRSVFLVPPLFAVENTDLSPLPAPYEKSEFPPWMQDLRRFEIVFFGTIPFSVFYSSIGYSFYSYASSGWDTAYAPAVLGNSTPPILTNSEKLDIIGIALGLSASAAVFDFILGKVFK